MYKPRPRGTDYIQQLTSYIIKNLQKGYTPESLKWALIDQGHSRTEIERAIKQATEQMAQSAPKMVEKPMIKVEVEPVVVEKAGFFSRVKGWFA
jgi:hypothetical protein